MEQQDHDLLIEIATKLDRAIVDINDLKDNTSARVSTLESEKLDSSEFITMKEDVVGQNKDKEERLRFLERWVWTAIGVETVIQFIIGYYLIAHFGNTPL